MINGILAGNHILVNIIFVLLSNFLCLGSSMKMGPDGSPVTDIAMTWYFGWLPYSGKQNVVVLTYFLCWSNSVKLCPVSVLSSVLDSDYIFNFYNNADCNYQVEKTYGHHTITSDRMISTCLMILFFSWKLEDWEKKKYISGTQCGTITDQVGKLPSKMLWITDMQIK